MATNNSINNTSASMTIYSEGAGNAQVTYSIPTVQDWSMGIDNSDSDRFKVSVGAILGTNDAMSINTTGIINTPLQPSFLATHGAAQNDVTGNGTVATVNFTTSVYNISGSYDGTNTFTAPVTGLYLLYFTVRVSQISSSTDVVASIVTTARNYEIDNNLSPIVNTNGQATISVTALADMTALDTAHCTIMVNGVGADTSDLPVGTTTTYFCGYLVA